MPSAGPRLWSTSAPITAPSSCSPSELAPARPPLSGLLARPHGDGAVGEADRPYVHVQVIAAVHALEVADVVELDAVGAEAGAQRGHAGAVGALDRVQALSLIHI